MNKFEKLIRDGFVEIDTASKDNFERSIENSSLKLSKESVSDDNRFILIGTEDERDQVEMCKGMTYFYNPSMWRVKSPDNKDDTNRRKEMKKNRVTKHSWDKNARKFSDLSNAAWNDLCAFANSHCRGEKKREAFLEELCVIVDKYIEFTCALFQWCHKNGLNPRDFMCTVVNMGAY